MPLEYWRAITEDETEAAAMHSLEQSRAEFANRSSSGAAGMVTGGYSEAFP